MTALYLFIHRKDLRSNDLRAFDYISHKRESGIHLLVIDPVLADGRLDCNSGAGYLRQAASLLLQYAQAGKELHVLYGDPADIAEALMLAHPIGEVIVQADYTPYARSRDERLRSAAGGLGRRWTSIADQPLADLEQLPAYAGRSEPHKAFATFYRVWRDYIDRHYAPSGKTSVRDLETVGDLNAEVSAAFALPEKVAAAIGGAALSGDDVHPGRVIERFVRERLAAYPDNLGRFFEEGTSRAARYLNTGALSARYAFETAAGLPGAEAWIKQLGWRDFHLYQAMYNEDYFRYETLYDFSPLTDEAFEAWTRGATGVPIVDAAMTQLNRTGEMPGRLRAVTAMFLTKNLLCPFTLGEAYFRLHLSDYDNTLNRGGWLRSSSLGFDAAPYFCVMNPIRQSERYDPAGVYIRRWLPHLAGLPDKAVHQPQPGAIVDLKASRARAIDVYRRILHKPATRTTVTRGGTAPAPDGDANGG